ncbi:MAG TPA: HlyD family type I secretion periplasmic adaptor subunit [Devosia sp.]|jgi:HlyD family secretion protein|uniref:HlyD family type I secretion periplasmic adaptor subunit n=1 Tax=Devosia sp. TaxID=1871048 RepID=UPI002F958E31
MSDVLTFDDRRSLSRHSWVGVFAIFGLFGGFAYWASTVEIAGAVVASGSVVVESFPKRVQHQEGGIVSAIMVRNEERVEAGQTLVQLDATGIAANLTVLESQWREALVREARLLAEIEGNATFRLPSALADLSTEEEVISLLSIETQVFAARQTAQRGRAAQLSEQIAQLDTQIAGLTMQQAAVDQQLAILNDEIVDLEALRADGLVESSRVTTLNKQRAQLEGERGQLISVVAGAKATISERRLQIAQLDDDFLAEALEQLQAARRTIADTGEQIRATRDRLTRTEIKAPQAGVVHESTVHTIGGVISAGETLMQIVPQDDALMVTVQLSPMDVDRVSVGQDATLRLSGLDLGETPELTAEVAAVAPNVTQDPTTGLQFYSARILIPEGELSRLPTPELLVPGMPVEVFIKTDERTVLSYLVQPFADQLNRAMRED